jgi:hypothetical protein
MAVPELVGPIGASATKTTTEAEYALGTRASGKDGSEFVYVQADGAITAADVVILSEAWQADQLDTTNSNGALGDRVGVARTDFANDEYGWVQTHGVCDALNATTGCAANTKLNSTGTAGRIDDDGAGGAESIAGLYLTAEAADNSAPAILSYPFIDATL